MLLTDLLAFVGTFLILLLFERIIHRSLQELMLLLTNDAQRALMLYSVVLLPGVALHELSHAVMAKLLGVKVRRFSLLPKRQSGGIQLGYVEINQASNLTSSLIGAAPLFTGLVALILMGWFVFDFEKLAATMQAGSAQQFFETLFALTRKPDAWLWFYFVFAIANTMMPSPSDKQAWPPVLIAMGGVAALVLLIGGADLVQSVAPFARATLRWLTALFVITAFVDLIVVVGLWLLRRLVEVLTGRRLRYK